MTIVTADTASAHLGLPEPVLHVALDHNGEGAALSLSGRRIGNRRARLLGLLHRVLDVFDRNVGSHDRLLMGRQWLPDAHESSVRSSRDVRLPEIGVWRTKREAV